MQAILDDVKKRAEILPELLQGPIDHPAEGLTQIHKYARAFAMASAPQRGRDHLGMRRALVAIAAACVRTAADLGLETEDAAVAMDDPIS